MRLQYIGRPKTWRDADTGNLVSDLDSIHRTDALEGDFDEFGADYDDFDEFGDDSDEDFGDEDSDEDFGEDSSDDDDSDDDDGEFGRSRGRKRRQARRSKRRSRRKSRRSRRRGGKEKAKVPRQKTILSGEDTSASAGAVTISITPAHKFWAEDIAFNGSSASATVTSISFGDNLIWNNSVGVDVAALSTASFIRGLVKGAKSRPGVPITINGTIAAGGDTLKAAIVGYKPGKPC